ncbi:hypothetical protein F4779DRAFT_427658 [Xylariaceae sp. FL0662B]|nr:hypothetical protein F4779DRAFT_427658 [Xylariaceae sp. FL0662B]
MTMASVTVKIKNNTGLSNPQQYYLVYDGATVISNSGQSFKSVVVYRTKLLSQGGVSPAIRLGTDLLGFTGTTNTQSTLLTTGNLIDLGDHKPATPGKPYHDDGSELRVYPSADGDDVLLEVLPDRTSDRRTFTIHTDSKIRAANYFVTGIARKVNDEERPVAAIAVIPGQQNVINPSLTLYVCRCGPNDTPEECAVVDLTKAATKAAVPIIPGQKSVTISNQLEGTNNTSVFKFINT